MWKILCSVLVADVVNQHLKDMFANAHVAAIALVVIALRISKYYTTLHHGIPVTWYILYLHTMSSVVS